MRIRRTFQPSTWGRSTPNREHSSTPTPSGPSASVALPSSVGYDPSSSRGSHPFSGSSQSSFVVVNSAAPEEEETCPVCLESLSFSYRLPGEKPHIVPECGHALHEQCFTSVYGPIQRGGMRQTSLGLCGVCRRPMKLGDSDTTKGNKLAMLTGFGASASSVVYPGKDRAGPGGHEIPSPGSGARPEQTSPGPRDSNEDDPLDHSESVHSRGSADHAGHGSGSQYMVTPAISVRPEFSTINRTSAASQPLTCLVVIELSSRRPAGPASSPSSPQPSLHHRPSIASSFETDYGGHHHLSSPPPSRPEAIPENAEFNPVSHPASVGRLRSNSDLGPHEYGISRTRDRADSNLSSGQYSHAGTSSDVSSPPPPPPSDSAFAGVVADLGNRMHDWKGHSLAGLGPLLMFDILGVQRDTTVREFVVYLFQEAIICVLEEKKKSLSRLLANSGEQYGSTSNGPKGVLRLKGRIFVRHIKRVIDSSASGELSLTIDMEDESLESFVIVFKDRSALESWRSTISSLVAQYQEARSQSASNALTQSVASTVGAAGAIGDHDRAVGPHGGYDSSRSTDSSQTVMPSKAARILSIGGTSMETSASSTSRVTSHDSLMDSSHRGSTVSSVPSSSHLKYPSGSSAGHGVNDYHSPTGLYDTNSSSYQSSGITGVIPAQTRNGLASNSLTPVPHTPIDLICVISVPPPTSNASTAALKTRVMKTSIDFIMGSLGARDRLSLVTYEVGAQGRIRRTPFLSVSRAQSKARLGKFIDTIGEPVEEGAVDEFAVSTGREERTDVVTGVNHGLDIVLQRKNKNPISGMLLVSDAADSTRRAQMDLVLARAEAANIPIHSFGYGKSHDPASLWLMSNHTNGTYTFVKDWYDLRTCLAGCIGGMMSIALTNIKLHFGVIDKRRFKMRKVSGAPHALVSTTGVSVDIDIGELRYGERKEMLVELELDNTTDLNGVPGNGVNANGEPASPNATEQFVQGMGGMNLGGASSLLDGAMDRMIDEVPVFELDGAFHDPAVGKSASRLANPVLLTVTLMPHAAGQHPRPPQPISEIVIVRRRMELLASDMITRALVLISRKNTSQAQKILEETKRILHTVLQNVAAQGVNPINTTGARRSRKELLSLTAIRTLQSILQDLQVLIDALEDDLEMFQHDHRNYGAQQAMILRDQKSWTGRTPTEKLFWVADNSLELVGRSNDWVSNVPRG